jgi:CBS domain-containing protein
MKVGELCSRDVRLAYRKQPLAEAAREMLAFHVGALIVTEPGAPVRRAVGILTDRDIVRGQLGRAADLFCLTVEDVMTADPLTLGTDTEVSVAIEALNAKAVRRAPVVDRTGTVIGIVTLDDLLPALAEEFRSLASLMGLQARQEHRSRTR